MEKYAKAFNEWMRRYIESPEQFAREFQSVQEFLSSEGGQPTYGASCATYFEQLLAETAAA